MRSDLPIVLKEGVEYSATEIGVVAPVANRCRLGQPEQNVCQIVAVAWYWRPFTIVDSSGRAAEGEGAAPVRITPVVELDPSIFDSSAEGMNTSHVGHTVA